MYSQNNEEKYILDYFGSYVGTFIDIGANDGITLSNTRRLAELGWSGVMVEASPKAYARLEATKLPNVYSFNLALSNIDGEMTLNESGELLGKGDVALVSTFHQAEMDRFKSVLKYTPVQVQAVTWNTLLSKSPIKYFDLVSIDIEGEELNVMPQMDFTQTRMIVAEWNGKNKERFVQICSGFRLIGENAENLIFAR